MKLSLSEIRKSVRLVQNEVKNESKEKKLKILSAMQTEFAKRKNESMITVICLVKRKINKK